MVFDLKGKNENFMSLNCKPPGDNLFFAKN